MMPWNRLVIERRGELITRLCLHVGEIDIEDTWCRAVLRRVAIMRLGRRFLAPGFDRAHLDRGRRKMAEQLSLPRADPFEQPIGLGHIGEMGRASCRERVWHYV